MGVQFPGESAEYREARDRLLAAEIDLRRATEAVAETRRALPPGGIVPEDYLFDGEGGKVRLSELFDGHDSLFLYSYMYSPSMAQPCGSCTSILDSLDGAVPHLTQKIAVAAVARSPIERFAAFGSNRGWRHLRLVSAAGNTYNSDYFGEDADGNQWPMLNVFRRDGNDIRHFWGAEILYAPEDPGQDGRQADFLWPVWGVLDVTPEGRGATWNPSVSYT